MADTPGDEKTLHSAESSAHHVDIREAEEIFNNVSRTLSRQSQNATAAASLYGKDIEKIAPEDEDRFDLREYLQSSNDANQAAGIKHKHVGVTWEDLQVDGVGGVGHKVC